MAKTKWGKCPDCPDNDQDKPLVARRCIYHNNKYKLEQKGDKLAKTKKKTTIRKVSDKEATRQRKYSKIRAKWIITHDICEMRAVFDCQFYATDVHHMKGRSGELLFDTKWWKAGCRKCHSYVESHPAIAIEKGLTISRLKNE